MPLTFLTAFPILADVVRNKKRHVDYTRVTELADYYRKLITGENAEDLLLQFVRREDATMFEQRVAITSLLTEAWAETLMTPFARIGRLDNVKKLIAFDSDVVNADERISELEGRLDEFNGSESLEKYLGSRFMELTFTDPNAFIAVEFDAFNNLSEKARPYPVEYSSAEAIDFRYANNTLQYLIVEKGENYLMYLPNQVIRLTRVKNHAEATVIGENLEDRIVNQHWQASVDRVYFVEFFTPNAGQVQAVRVGYKSDLRTKSRTFVNPFHATLPYFKKSIKVVSEADLSSALHAFPHVSLYEEECNGFPEENITCRKGYDINGVKCKKCKGRGKLTLYTTTTQDAISLKLPKPGEPTTGVTPQNVIDFKSPDVAILNWQDDKVDRLKNDAIATMYGNDVLQQTTIDRTATGATLKREEIYNTLHPAAENVSAKWKFFTAIIAVLLDNPKPRLLYEHPSDYKIQTVDELLEQLGIANKSGGPASLKQAIALDIAAKIYVDDDFAFLKEKVKAKWVTMLGKSEETVLMLISLGKLTDEEEILWVHSDSIFDDLENEIPDFFYFTYDKQKPYVLKKIDAIKKALAAKNNPLIPLYENAEA